MSRIFVVEDEGVVSEDITQTLEQLGYTVAGAAQSGEEALAALAEAHPDLVLMDIKLAGPLDGIQTTAELRKRWSVPVIYLTSHSDEATLRRAKETGPHGYLLKPFNERDLRTAIEVAIRKHDLEQRLEQRERWFSTTLESVGDAVIATDPNARITFMNSIAETITGWKKEDAQGKSIHEVFRLVPSGIEEPRTVVGNAIRDGFRAELPLGTKLKGRDGKMRDVDDSIAPIMDGSGRSLGSVLVFRDITEKRRLEERLVLAERLASIATMAAGMAHEINNPLAATVGNVEFAARRLEEFTGDNGQEALPPALAEALKEVGDALADAQLAGARVRRIVSDLKKFSRTEEGIREIVDLPDVVQAALNVTHHLVHAAVRVTSRVGTTPLVAVQEGQLVQVLSNLIANAIEAREGDAGHEVEIITKTSDLGRAVIEVKDTGEGIHPDYLPRIFEPFFTTKPTGDGLGLGLSICQSIVGSAGGEITVESQQGRGTTFRVELPPAEAREKRLRPDSTPPVSKRRARVLVIDDEEMIGRMIERLLRGAHDVHLATSPVDGLSRVARGEVFDVVLCDLTMPSVTGMDVYNAILGTNADLASRMIFLTGGVVAPRLQQFLDGGKNVVIQKPFSRAKLLTAIEDQLG